MATLQLGPFMIQTQLLILFIAAVLGYGTILLVLKPLPEAERKKISDIILSISVMPIVVWKFGPLIMHPVQLFHQPLLPLILFSKGTQAYWIVGFSWSLAYFIYKLYKDKVKVYYTLDALIIGIVIFLSIKSLFITGYGKQTFLPWGISIDHSTNHYHPVNFYHLIVLGFIGAWFLYKKFKLGEGQFLSYFLILFGIGNMLVSYVSVEYVVFLSLSRDQWVNMVMICLGWVLNNRRINRKSNGLRS